MKCTDEELITYYSRQLTNNIISLFHYIGITLYNFFKEILLVFDYCNFGYHSLLSIRFNLQHPTTPITESLIPTSMININCHNSVINKASNIVSMKGIKRILITISVAK